MARSGSAWLACLAAIGCAGAHPIVIGEGGEPPPGWVRVEAPASSSAATLCTREGSGVEWSIEDGEVRVRPPEAEGVVRDLPYPLPARLMPNRFSQGRALRVASGWLVAVDGGEWGGGLWAMSEQGAIEQQLLEGTAVRGLAELPWGFLALVGAPHGYRPPGEAVTARRVGWRWMLGPRWPLGTAAAAFGRKDVDTVVVATLTEVVEISRGGVRKLVDLPEAGPPIASVTETKAGVVHVGMRGFVLVLTPSGPGYRQEWWAPAGCSVWERASNEECTCR